MRTQVDEPPTDPERGELEERRYRFSLRDLWRQVSRDLFSKGVQTGYSTTYAWLADQFGHFSFGFILFADARLFFGDSAFWTKMITATGVSVFILIEWSDYRAAVRDAVKAGLFPLRRLDVAKDAGTAVWYVLSGVIVCAQTLVPRGRGAALLICVLSADFVVARWWLCRKMCFQRADLPFVFRLANLKINVTQPAREAAVEGILQFVGLQGVWRHLIIAGPLRSGTTSLACAISSEHTFQLGTARYLPYLAFRQMLQANDDPASTETRPLWPWDQSNIVILDDLDILRSGVGDVQQQFETLRSLPRIDLLQKRRTVWVLNDVTQMDLWKNALSRILKTQAIGVVELGPRPDKSIAIGRVAAKGFI